MKYRILIPIFFLLLLSVSCEREYRHASGMVWNTVYNVTFQGDEALVDSILPTLDAVASSVSAFDSLSLVSQINRNETARTDSLFRCVYNASRMINERSEGAFDPTVSPLVNAWGFGKSHKASADTAHIDDILKYVGIQKTRLQGNLLLKDDSRIQFNFSAIAKGYGCDALAQMLLKAGVDNFLIEIGGEVVSHGVSKRGDNWRISVDAPIVSNGVIHKSQCVLSLNNNAVATSGNYRNFKNGANGLYGHTIDPKSGRPVLTDVLSATVVAPTCMEADAYATAIMAMGFNKAKVMVEKYNLAVLMVLGDGKTWYSPNFKQYIGK